MKKVILFLLISTFTLPAIAQGQTSDSIVWGIPDTMKPIVRPVSAAIEAAASNIVVWGFNRYISRADHARISWKTFKANVKGGFVWDNDSFSTNLFFHPYQGGLYFNAARSNGLNFWQSLPYSAGGSFMWEVVMENEPPAINDFIVTTLGGALLGEVTFRLSSLLLDETATGTERVFREIGAAIISPMRGFNRLIRGDVKRKTNRVMDAYGWEKRPIEFLVGTSYRYLADGSDFLNGANCFSMDLGIMYGEPFHMEKTHAPLDYFDLRGTISFGGNQPVISSVNVNAIWWGRHIEPAPGHNMLVGVFQHMNYYDSNVLKRSKEQRAPFKIGEIASLGVGMMYRLPTLSQNIDMVVNMHGSTVILGGYLSDYFELIDRDYNYGSGFSAKVQTMLNIRRIGTFTMDIYHLNLYSWHEGNIERMYLWKSDTEERQESNKRYYLYTSSQGNKGWARLTILNPRFDFKLVDKLRLSLGVNFYTRATYYSDIALEDNTYDSFEIKAGLTYRF